MSFGLTNASSRFHSLTNKVLNSFLRKFASVFIDDILITALGWRLVDIEP